MYPVQMVNRISKLRRENGRSGQEQHPSEKLPSFHILLDHSEKECAAEEGCLVTYNAKSQLQTHYYRQSREYTY